MRIAALIMAAGQSSRFQGCKVLTHLNQVPMLQLAIDKLIATGLDDIFIVSGAWHEDILQAQLKGEIIGANILHNSDWAQGLGCSITLGVSAIAEKYDAVLVTLADQVAITSSDFNELLTHIDSDTIVCAKYQDKRGVPAIFPANSFEHLMTLTGDQGAKKLLYLSSFSIVECDMPLAAIDIDTQQELSHWLSNNH